MFLRWSLFLSVLIVALMIGAAVGWVKLIWTDDATRISIAILIVFAITTALCGRMRWQLNRTQENHALDEKARERVLTRIERKCGHGIFASSACVTLGLLGTVVGLYMMLKQAPVGAAAEVLANQIRIGLSTALLTTIIGGFFGLLLEAQFHFLEQSVLRIRNGEDDEDE
jgi:biopolymer transport protein ExbB/TolQ